MARARSKDKSAARLKTSERRRQILLELELRLGVNIRDLAMRFDVSTDTGRRSSVALSDEGRSVRARRALRSDGLAWSGSERTAKRAQMSTNVSVCAPQTVCVGDTNLIATGLRDMHMAKPPLACLRAVEARFSCRRYAAVGRNAERTGGHVD